MEYKIRIINREQYNYCAKWLYDKGYRWGPFSTKFPLYHSDIQALYLYQNMSVRYESSIETFLTRGVPELNLEEAINNKLHARWKIYI